MAEYIDRKALEKNIADFIIEDSVKTAEEKAFNRGLHRALRCLNKAPAVDVVEVVRCKDCKYSRPLREDLRTIYKPGVVECQRALRDERRPPDSFCPYGERKEQK